MDELPLPLAVRDISSSSSPQFLEKSDAWSHFHAEVQEACRSMIEKKPDRSSWWDWLLGRGVRKFFESFSEKRHITVGVSIN